MSKFRAEQVENLEAEFQRCNYVSAEVLDELESALGLSVKQIRTWFRNRRTKARRLAEKVCLSRSRRQSNGDDSNVSSGSSSNDRRGVPTALRVDTGLANKGDNLMFDYSPVPDTQFRKQFEFPMDAPVVSSDIRLQSNTVERFHLQDLGIGDGFISDGSSSVLLDENAFDGLNHFEQKSIFESSQHFSDQSPPISFDGILSTLQ